LYFSATEAQDGPFFVVEAVWHLLHFSLAMMSSAGPATAAPANAMADRATRVLRVNFIRVLHVSIYASILASRVLLELTYIINVSAHRGG
jgi:hypothetical protein